MKINKEILAILFLFLVVFTVISLGSYHPEDPAFLFGTKGEGRGAVHNMFGVLGAHTSGFFVGLFGIGAFWIPPLMIRLCWRLNRKINEKDIVAIVSGGAILILSTGTLLSIWQTDYSFFGRTYNAGGLFGIPVKSFLVGYSNIPGSVIILAGTHLIGLILAMGLSFEEASGLLVRFFKTAFNPPQNRGMDSDGKNGKKEDGEKKTPSPLSKNSLKSDVSNASRAKIVEIRKTRSSPEKVKDSPKGSFHPPPEPQDAVYVLPGADFLDPVKTTVVNEDDEELRMQSALLQKKLEDFGVAGSVTAVTPGPVITTFEYKPASGVKINKIVNLSDDLALALRAMSIRIVAPIPGKGAIGIEIPNADRQVVSFRDIVTSEAFLSSPSDLSLCLGKDIVGNPVVAQLNKMPHLLIAGATGTGKSVSLNTMICSLLYKATPDRVKMILIDPKRIELSIYDGIPHLIAPVISDAKKATYALHWAVKEMEHRYELLSEKKARNIDQYNQKIEKSVKKSSGGAKIGGAEENASPEILPYIVIIIDELADLMMIASREVELSLTRLAQMARASGIHIILATQRPSVDVLTGLIKANFPTRLSFQVSSKIDSRTIIDSNGAENLLGNGDMLFLPPGTAKLMRIQGAFMSEKEVTRIVDFLKEQPPPTYIESVLEAPRDERGNEGDEDFDDRYDDAVALVTKTRQASISMVQRHLRVGYNRAARIVEMMERNGVVGPSDGVKPREVLARSYEDFSP